MIGACSQVRGLKGIKMQPNARPDNIQMRPLELWGYECSPFVRPVREKLDVLGLPHVMVRRLCLNSSPVYGEISSRSLTNRGHICIRYNALHSEIRAKGQLSI